MKCEICGENQGKRVISGISVCEGCFSKIVAVREFDDATISYFMDDANLLKASEKGRMYIRELVSEKAAIKKEKTEKEEQERQLMEKNQKVEDEKREYAHSVEGYYEYKVVTIKNDFDGTVAEQNLQNILNEYAAKGWKLHSIYSNELGKNSLFGINATIGQDILIFERKIGKAL